MTTSTERDPFRRLWAALAEKLTGPLAFAWEPDRFTLRQWHERGCVLHAMESPAPWLPPSIAPTDPTWSDPDAEEDAGPNAMLDVWPELKPHLPSDGRFRAVATISVNKGTPDVRDIHQVREIDLDSYAMSAPLTVLPFGAHSAD